MSSVLIIIEKLKFEDKFKYCTRESESNYHNKITQKIRHINSNYFSFSCRVFNMSKIIQHNEVHSKYVICRSVNLVL